MIFVLEEETVEHETPLGLSSRIPMCAAIEADEGLQRDRGGSTLASARH